jgi:hypothetical protein
MSDRVYVPHTPAAQRTPAAAKITPAPCGVMRKCACGGSSGEGNECHECKKKKMELPHGSTDRNRPSTSSTMVHDALRSPGDALERQPSVSREAALGHDFGQLRVRPDGPEAVAAAARPPFLQTKLAVGQAGDGFEREADRVADAVVSIAPGGGGARRQGVMEAHSGRDQHYKRTPASPLPAAVTALGQGKTVSAAPDAGLFDGEPAGELTLTRGGGSPLDKETQTFMAGRFGFDFSSVRVHADSQAARMNRRLNALAFTYGDDIYLRSPASVSDYWLLAHELTHVVQQSGGGRSVPRAGYSQNQLEGPRTSAEERKTIGREIATSQAEKGASSRGQQMNSATFVSGRLGTSVRRFLLGKCSSEKWNAIAAWGTILGTIAATIAALIGLGVITVGTAAAATPVTAPASIAVIVAGAILTLAGIAWAISAHEALSKCLESDPDADAKDKDENRKKLDYLEKKQKEIEDQVKEKQRQLDELRKNFNEDGTPKKKVPTVNVEDLPTPGQKQIPTVNVEDLPKADQTPIPTVNVEDLPKAK